MIISGGGRRGGYPQVRNPAIAARARRSRTTIGGTSLFGGHGRVIDAVLGGLVVAVIVNGMSDLIQGANSSGYEYVVTGLVLLVAAGFDAVVRHGRPG